MGAASPAAREIGRRVYNLADQEAFARLSLDRNPMHVDPIAARRLITGRPVVHGMHVLISCLEFWANEDGRPLTRLDATFASAVSVDDVVVFAVRATQPNQVVVQASVDGVVCTNLRVTLGTSTASSSATPRNARDPAAAAPATPVAAEPTDEPAAYHLNRRYALSTPSTGLPAVYPGACRHLGAQRIAGLLTLSYFVGMVCPGLNSIFASVTLELDQSDAISDAVQFSVDRYDERFRLFTVSLQGALTGRLTAFLRQPPLAQPSMQAISREVATDEFKGSRSLVIGASRGLGELTGKILCAGGGDVTLAYAHGLQDVQQVQAEIASSGLGQSRILHLDVTDEGCASLATDGLEAIYFFATPRIGRKKAALYAPVLFNEFVDFYVRSLHDLCVRIEAASPPKMIQVYAPSSVYIEERPDGMTEYAMAKAAAEVLIADINRSFKKVRVLATRLPKLSTDQTSSILNERTADNLAALLPVVRAMNAKRD